jgi:hypothetical protein
MDVIKQMDKGDRYFVLIIAIAVIEIGVQIVSVLLWQ